MTCESEPAGVWGDADPESAEFYYVDFTAKLTRWREAGKEYGSGVRFRVRGVPGFEYEVTSPGQAGQREPIFPRAVGLTVQDGSATLTCRALSTASLITTISGTPTWSCDDPALSFSGQSLTDQIAKAKITLSGAVDGTDYEVLVKATGADGQVIPKRCILPVRIAERVCQC
jgi:hypothetical protein